MKAKILQLYGKARTNFRHVGEEFEAWKIAMVVSVDQFRRAKGWQKGHKLLNFLTETIRALPYTIAHLLVIGLVVWILV